MKQVVQDPKYGEIIYEESAFLGNKSVSVGGEALKKESKKDFRMPDGTLATLTGNFSGGVRMQIGADVIQLTPKIKWYEIALCVLPFLLIMVWGNVVALCEIVPVVGGAIGGAISGAMSMLALYLMRMVKPIGIKVAVALAVTAVTFVICWGIGSALLSALT